MMIRTSPLRYALVQGVIAAVIFPFLITAIDAFQGAAAFTGAEIASRIWPQTVVFFAVVTALNYVMARRRLRRSEGDTPKEKS